MGFDDLSMSAITALGHLRRYANAYGVSMVEALGVVPNATSDRRAHDYQAAMRLDVSVRAENLLGDLAADIRKLLLDLLAAENPNWLPVVRSGRDYVRTMLDPNTAQVFDVAELFSDEPTWEIVDWWDQLALVGWSDLDARKFARGREAERRSFAYERQRLEAAGCLESVKWVSLDDNQAGFDIASWELEAGSWVPLPIEVKSTVAAVPEFHLSRGEFETAARMRGNYRFHVWARGVLNSYERDEVVFAGPSDGKLGRWVDATFALPASPPRATS